MEYLCHDYETKVLNRIKYHNIRQIPFMIVNILFFFTDIMKLHINYSYMCTIS